MQGKFTLHPRFTTLWHPILIHWWKTVLLLQRCTHGRGRLSVEKVHVGFLRKRGKTSKAVSFLKIIAATISDNKLTSVGSILRVATLNVFQFFHCIVHCGWCNLPEPQICPLLTRCAVTLNDFVFIAIIPSCQLPYTFWMRQSFVFVKKTWHRNRFVWLLRNQLYY
jgi:hypothetical protein